ncbi:MAG: tripartite tricarboxylate transporter TctB family protein [Planctomycetota bacterium]|jgi:hypothetical protein|nr:tripartite tricarboxylate transporter TctB family protein [Planctomycetota bacterium]
MKPNTFFQRCQELIFGVVMLAVAGVYAYNIQFIRIRANVRVSARLIPEMLGVLVAALAVMQIVRGVRLLMAARRKNSRDGIPAVFLGRDEKLALWPVILTFIIITGYALAFPRLGFVISSSVCIFVQMLTLTPRGGARPGLFLAVSLLTALAIYLAFRFGLNLTLPQGILEGVPYLR